MLSPERWLLSLTLDIPDSLNLRRWLSPPAMVLFECGVAPMWPEPVREQCTEPTDHDDSQAPASAMRSRRPSTVLEMFWSTEPTWISVPVGATQLQTFLLGQKRHDGGSQPRNIRHYVGLSYAGSADAGMRNRVICVGLRK
jgi:hypothetical protein